MVDMNNTGGKIKKNHKKKNGKMVKLSNNKSLLLMFAPAAILLILFNYIPMAGMSLAFRNVDSSHLPFGTAWIGFQNFSFLSDRNFWNALTNTVHIAFWKILIGFPAPIIFALLLNEIGNKIFKNAIQTISYLPHFISWVVVANLLDRLLSTDSGIINAVIRALGGDSVNFMARIDYFLPLAIITDVWKNIGFSSIVYLAAITQINNELYEAAKVDGAGRFRRIWSITLPGIMPMVSMMLILTVPNILNAGFDQIYLLANPINQPVSEILDTYVLRMGLSYGSYGFATAMGIFNSVLSLILLVVSNKISAKMGGSTLW